MTATETFPADYLDRVYAGVLGKIIGVYLGRPVEGWPYEKIAETYGEVDRYIHESRGVPLVVTDDDISGTFTFLRALPDHGNDPDLTRQSTARKSSPLWWRMRCRTGHQPVARFSGQPDPDRIDDCTHYRGRTGMARRGCRLAQDPGKDPSKLWVRQIRRCLPHGAQSRPDYHGAPSRR